MSDLRTELHDAIRIVPDFPKQGIQFKDITPVLADARLFAACTAAMVEPWQGAGITHVVAIESRGFLFGAPMATALGVGLVPARKPGKLPSDTVRETYALEYGTDALELHADALGAGDRVLVVDDVLATGGTADAACKLVERVRAQVVGVGVFIDLAFLGGRARLAPIRVESVLQYL